MGKTIVWIAAGAGLGVLFAIGQWIEREFGLGVTILVGSVFALGLLAGYGEHLGKQEKKD